MKVVCSYCNKNMPDKEPFSNDSISHTICPDCYVYFKNQWGGQSLDQYLDNFEIPVMIMNRECRIIAANGKAAELTGKPRHEVSGLLGGEALECSYSRLPEGCGRTVHCETCTVRNIVNYVMSSREPQYSVPVKILQENREVNLTFSAEMIGDLVKITIQD